MPDIDTSPAALREWHLGAMNDGLFIIDAPPRPSTDDIVHDRKDGPTMVLNVTDLPEPKARAIVKAHNAAIQTLRAIAAEKAEAERDASRWQPIETAPRDGTRLWCFWPDAWPDETQAIGWFVLSGEAEYWTNAADSEPNPPTHWMPLPAAPANPEDHAHD